MTSLSQEEIISNTKTVVQGLDTLRNEHNQILDSLLSSMKTIKEKNGETNLVEEKTNILKRSIDQIDLGLGEAQVSKLLACTKAVTMSHTYVANLSLPNIMTVIH